MSRRQYFMAERQYELGEAELEVLKTLWQHGPASVREVLMQLHQKGRRVAYTTVLTFLTRLEQKGFARSDKSEQAYIYRAVVSRDRVRRSKLKELVEQLYDGDAAPLVLQLIRTERFSPDEIEQLQKLIEDLDRRGARNS